MSCPLLYKWNYIVDMSQKQINVMFSAGDPSGDRHAADVINELKRRFPDARFSGLGGPLMSRCGFNSFLPFDKMNVMGLIEIVKHIPFLLNCKKEFINKLNIEKPDALVCVDYSGFNMPLAKAAKKLNIPVVWYIVPKFWAWRRKTYTTFLKKFVDRAAVIFPFVTKSYNGVSDNMEFVGNPLVEQNRNLGYDFDRDLTKDLKGEDEIRIALTPGSRKSEIVNILPVMVEACNLLQEKYPNLKVEVSKWSGFTEEFFRNIVGRDVILTEDPLEELFKRCDMTIITSGTATLQAALAQIPMVILFKSSPLSVWIYQKMVTGVSHMGLPNIVAQKEVVPELIQEDASSVKICELISNYIDDKVLYNNTIKNLRKIKEDLGHISPSVKVADIIENLLNKKG